MSCLGRVQGAVLYLESLPKDRAEAVCQRALTYGANRVTELKSIVLNRLDEEIEAPAPTPPTTVPKFARRIQELTRGHQGDAHDQL